MKIGLGTAAIGRPQYINIRQEKPSPFELQEFKRNTLKVLDQAYKAGVRYFDTAPGYGLAEEVLIEWLNHKNDPTIEVATKWGYTYTANFDLQAEKHEVKEHSLSKLNEQWTKSKELLPRLSTYQVHSATFDTGVLKNQPILDQLAQLKEQHGLKVGITVSGAQQKDILEEAVQIEHAGIRLFDVYQVTYNLLDNSLRKTINELSSLGCRVIIKEGLANGRVFPNTNYPAYQNLYQVLTSLSNKYEAGIDAIALRYCLDTVDAFSVLSGAATATQVTENLKALAFKLTTQEIEMLSENSVSPEKYWSERKSLPWN